VTTRRTIATLVAAIALLALVAPPALASAQRVTAPETVQSNYQGYTNCVDASSQNYFTGKTLPYNPAWIRDGVSMHVILDDYNLGFSTDFHFCADTTGTDVNQGSNAFVAFGGTSTTAIIQIGMIQCDSLVFTDCASNHNVSYFWAVGGCGGAIPYPHLFGNALTYGNDYQFEIYDDGLGNFVMLALDQTSSGNSWSVTIAKNTGAISCWDATWGLDWLGERNDRGDGLGSALHKTTFVDMYTHHAGVWALTSFGPGSAYCSADSPSGYPSSCWILTGGNDMQIYTGN
jgi:hypothetical protein